MKKPKVCQLKQARGRCPFEVNGQLELIKNETCSSTCKRGKVFDCRCVCKNSGCKWKCRKHRC